LHAAVAEQITAMGEDVDEEVVNDWLRTQIMPSVEGCVRNAVSS
jgi:hypothetical protein